MSIGCCAKTNARSPGGRPAPRGPAPARRCRVTWGKRVGIHLRLPPVLAGVTAAGAGVTPQGASETGPPQLPNICLGETEAKPTAAEGRRVEPRLPVLSLVP